MNTPDEFHLKKHPIILVLAQIRFSPILSIDNVYLPGIQEGLRLLGFSMFEHISQSLVVMTPQGPQPQQFSNFRFYTVDRKESVVVTNSFVTYQATEYDTFVDFTNRLLAIAHVIAELTKGFVIQRIGLRYIDALVPTDTGHWQTFLKNGLFHMMNSPDLDSVHEEHVHQIVVRSKMGGTMIIRVISHPDKIPFPPDLMDMQLQYRDYGRLTPGLGFATIDTDHYIDLPPQNFSEDVVAEYLKSLKSVSLRVWRQHVISEKACAIWNS